MDIKLKVKNIHGAENFKIQLVSFSFFIKFLLYEDYNSAKFINVLYVWTT